MSFTDGGDSGEGVFNLMNVVKDMSIHLYCAAIVVHYFLNHSSFHAIIVTNIDLNSYLRKTPSLQMFSHNVPMRLHCHQEDVM